MRKEIKAIFLGLAGAFILSVLMFSLLSSSQYYTVAEILDIRPEGLTIAVMGKVANNTIVYTESSLYFKLLDENNSELSIDVIYTGSKNVNVYDNAVVVVKGVYREGVIEAYDILTKCPSTYKPEEEELM